MVTRIQSLICVTLVLIKDHATAALPPAHIQTPISDPECSCMTFQSFHVLPRHPIGVFSLPVVPCTDPHL